MSDYPLFNLKLDDVIVLEKTNLKQIDLTQYLLLEKDYLVSIEAIDLHNQIITSISQTIKYKDNDDKILFNATFEDVSKTAYAQGNITQGNATLTLKDALIGTSANDQKNGSKSVRMRIDGFVSIDYDLTLVDQISLKLATYTGDTLGTIGLYGLSPFGEEIYLESIEAPLVLTEFNINMETYKDILNDIGYKLLIKHELDGRVNIDDIMFTSFQSGYYYIEDDVTYLPYYQGIDGLSGETLLLKLRDIISVMTPARYEDAKIILAQSDLDPEDDLQSVRGMYNQTKIATYWIGVGEGRWQREHVWPNSKLGVSSVNESNRNQASDLHNLRGIDGINQSRSNRYFVEGEGQAITVGSESFYPGDIDKGDVARILMYMVVRYEFLNLTNNQAHLVNNSATNHTLEGAFSGTLEILLKWHQEDPVDDFEIRRNNIIYEGEFSGNVKAQGNRNPFIDHPSLFESIYYFLVEKDNEQFNVSYHFVEIVYYFERKRNDMMAL